jgi:hypothetical protein
MTNNINNITAADFNAAIDMLTTMRDRALEIERDMRADDPIADFAEAVETMIDIDMRYSPDALAAMINLLDNIDR